ncbi:hypothetical protein DW892_05050 [Collinsella sp. AM40-7AC]|uniref:hypothetical protein n=1 Tax=Collinsella TaxID=102106 RepID=UPI000E4CA8B1|nr:MULTISPECIES: hypothetical protein [Collinsella]RHB19129.1 hypothetical protein DW892_05050 [Collinsella sp. AM40-7AC]
MNVTKCYALWYTGDGLHRVLNAAKQEAVITDAYNLLGNGTVTGKQMAERLLDNLEFDTKQQERYAMQIRDKGTLEATKATSREIDKVHRLLGDEIRSKWDKPIISDEQLENALYLDAIQDELPDIKNKIPIELKCG